MICYVVWSLDNSCTTIHGVFLVKSKADAACEAIEWFDFKGISEQMIDNRDLWNLCA